MLINFRYLLRKNNGDSSLMNRGVNPRQSKLIFRSKYFLLLLFLTFTLIGETFAKSLDLTHAFPGNIENTNSTNAKNDISQVPTNSPVVEGNVLTNDSDNEGDSQSVQSATYLNSAGASEALLLSTPTNIYDVNGDWAGSIELRSNGIYNFNPIQDYTGTVTVHYVATDNNTSPATDMAALSIEVLPYPSVNGDHYTTITQDDTNTVEQGGTVTSFIKKNDTVQNQTFANTVTATASNGWGGFVTLTSNLQDIYNDNAELAGQAKVDGNGNIQFVADASFEGKVTIDYTTGAANTAKLTITVEPADATDNDTYVNDDASIGLMEENLMGNVLVNDYDPEGDNQVISSASSHEGILINLGTMTEIEGVGNLLLKANGDYTFTPNATFTGTERIEYTVCDNNTTQACAKGNLYLTMLPTNSTFAENDIHQVAINTLAKGFLLTNDRDEEGDVQKVESASYLNASGQSEPLPFNVETEIYDENGALTGTIELADNGSYTFDPVAEFTGKAVVNYIVSDDNGNRATDAAVLDIYVLANPLDIGFNNNVIGHDDTNTVEAGGAVASFPLWNDRDIDGSTITIASAEVSNSTGGTTALGNGVEEFYDADGNLAGSGNWTGDRIIFKANPTFEGDVVVRYTVSDGLSTDEAVLTITVEAFKSKDNDTYANDDANVGLQDATLKGNVQGNDYDPEGVDQDISLIDTDGDGIPDTEPVVGVMTPISVQGTLAGTFTMDSKVGAYVWDPVQDFLGTVAVAYTATDGTANNTATLYLTNLPSNTTFAKDDINDTPFNTDVVGDVSTNDLDQEGNTRAFSLNGSNGGMSTAEGTVELNMDGSYVFTPATGFIGTATFQYEVCDDGYPVRCKIATVYIDVLPEVGVQAQPIIANMDVNATKSLELTSGNVLSNDVDTEEREMEVTTLFSGVTVSGINTKGELVEAAGKLSLNAAGHYSFISIGNFIGRVEKPYTTCLVQDGTTCDEALLIIEVYRDGGNTTYGNDDAAITDNAIAVAGNLLTNDNDIEGDAQSVVLFHYDSNGNGKANGNGPLGVNVTVGGYNMNGDFVGNAGVFSVAADGTYTFTPNNGFAGNVVLPYTVCDDGEPTATQAEVDPEEAENPNNPTAGFGTCSKASLVITVLGTKRDYSDAPEAYAAAWHRGLADNTKDNVLDGTDNVWLGSKTNFEIESLASPDAGNDDFDDAMSFGTNNGQFPEMMIPSADYDIDVELNSITTALVYYGMWIDWDNDGTYDDFYNGSSNVNGATTVSVPVTAPTYIGAIVNVRLRVDDNEFLENDFAGARTNGEVEDYQNVVALPVELLYFQGSNDDCSNELGWATATEKNNSHFIVEHSTDGEDFKELDRVEGNGNSVELIEYEFIHENITAKENYYRLKQVDFDGAFEYSDIIIVKSDCKELGAEKVSIYPNPSRGLVTTEISNESGVEKDIEIRVTDVLGRTLISKKVTIQNGINHEELDLTKYIKGTYMISIIKNGNEVETYPVSLLTD